MITVLSSLVNIMGGPAWSLNEQENLHFLNEEDIKKKRAPKVVRNDVTPASVTSKIDYDQSHTHKRLGDNEHNG